jgi:hypothetical protein
MSDETQKLKDELYSKEGVIAAVDRVLEAHNIHDASRARAVERVIKRWLESRDMIEQFCRDLNQAHDEIIKLQDETADPAEHDWPAWTPQANSIRWAEKVLGKRLAKTNAWTLYPDSGSAGS